MTSWEQDLLFVLANHVRILSLSQVAHTWWAGQRQASRRARESVQSMQQQGWVTLRRVLARPIVSLSHPLHISTSGSRQPGFDLLSKTLRSRARTDAKMTQILVATPKTRDLFGNGRVKGARLKLTQMTHDLHVTEIFLVYRRNKVDLRGWLSEDELPETWPLRQRPDALLVDSQGELLRAIEYGGDYPIDRLVALHNAFTSIDLPYEIW